MRSGTTPTERTEAAADREMRKAERLMRQAGLDDLLDNRTSLADRIASVRAEDGW